VPDESAMEKVAEQIGDIAGYMYRFSLPSSSLGKIGAGGKGGDID